MLILILLVRLNHIFRGFVDIFKGIQFIIFHLTYF